MSRLTKLADWTDSFTGKSGESVLPTDDFTPSNGTSFGLDTFEFDTVDNAGAADSARLPEARGISGLPDGIVTMAEGPEDYALTDDSGIVLSQEDVGLPKEAALVDLQWLDPTQPQDPNRLPNNEKTLDSVPSLEEAWGANRRTDGVHLVPAQDLATAQYLQSIKEPEHSNLPGNKNAHYEEAVREAALRSVRQAHFGHPITKIKSALVDALGHEAARTAKVVKALESEYGLLGRVYVRASAFPGLKNGLWTKEVRRSCRTARYVITDDATVADKLGMQQVASVEALPWAEAVAHYRPLLAASGVKLASGNPREVLRAAFLQGPEIKTPKSTLLPILQTEAGRVARQTEVTSLQSKEAALEAGLVKKVKADLLRTVKSGLLTVDEAKRIVAMGKSASETQKVIAAAVQAAGQHRLAEFKPGVVREYKGAAQHAAPVTRRAAPKFSKEQERVMLASKASGIAAGEFNGLLRWASQQMSEGALGKDLTDLMSARFSTPLLKAAAPMLSDLRKQHEGLAGHLYVDASAYASPTGSIGCEKNASKHRANGIKFVLAMSRCGSCVHKNADGVCGQYGKRLADEVPAADPSSYQQEMLRQAAGGDAVQTAALFDPREYNLHDAALDEISTDQLPTEKMAEVIFGAGPELED